MKINHNIPALRTLYQLNRNNTLLDKTMQRLSSGLRINSAADDAAGLAIAQKMDTQIRGLKQANRNAMDGISLIQTAEGALNEVHSMLQRIRELAIQSSNGTLAAEDRQAINNEVEELIKEIQRISDNIEFNEIKLLNGEIDRTAFSSNNEIADIVSMSDTVTPGKYTFTVTTAAKQNYLEGGAASFETDGTIGVTGKININGEQVEILETDTGMEVFGKIRDLCDTVGIELYTGGSFGDGKSLTFVMKEPGYEGKDIVIDGDTALLSQLGLTAGTFNQGVDIEIGPVLADAFPSNTTYEASGNRVEFRSTDNFKMIITGGVTKLNIDPSTGGVTEDTTTLTGDITINVLETGPLDLQIGANEGQFMQVRIQNLSPSALGLDDMSLSTTTAAQEAITIVDNAIEQISSVRSKLGAYQNRLEHTVANLEVASENMTASLSRIQDADMAEEMAEYTQKSILVQAGTSMLAQANQRPQQILQLLQG
ncbi:flagellin N-terminal helical domain-containing protein [Defluviitalea phaphyphila]|uniref:flagellin N-terminal helical domain-containing protein n=1 Tax=Defluviitalea phaphyphila TaxID=1473580 RepID=UPI00073187F9|nr:flagellin [Defluviitalea phaphyphila]